MKSLKYDYENINLSSNDIVSIAYNMPEDFLNFPNGCELQLLSKCIAYCHYLVSNQLYRDAIEVPDKSLKLFQTGHATVDGLKALLYELERLGNDVLNENHRSFKT